MRDSRFSLIVVAVAIAAFIGAIWRTQAGSSSSSATEGQRYAIVTSSGQFSETYVLDSQTGRVWMMRGQVSKQPGLVPCVYSLLNGKASLTPVDSDREVDLMNQPTPTGSSSDWQQQLDEMKKKADEQENKLFHK